MKRALALYIPFLSTDRLRKSRDMVGLDSRRSSSHTTGDEPVATISSRGQALHIVHLNRVAYEQGVRSGQTLADARAMVPNLVTYDDDPAADRVQLESLAVWAGCLSPIVHIEGCDTLIVNVTGCERLFGGEENLLNKAIGGLEAQGFDVRAAIADTPGGAWALAHAHPDPAVIAEPGRTTAELAPLSVWSLRIEPGTIAALASVGVETIASLLYLPRSSLASRFGDELLDRIDQALGDLPEVLTPYRPHPVLTCRFRLGAPSIDIEVLTEAIHRTLEQFCKRLERRVAGVSQMFGTFYCPDVVTETGTQTRAVTLEVNLSQPTRSVNHLFSLIKVLLDGLRLPAPTDSLMLWARKIDPLDGWQDELFTTDSNDARELGDLLDRLATRLGPNAVARPQPLSEHQPERAFRYVSLVKSNGTGRQSLPLAVSTAGPRPLRLSPRPIEIATTALVPEGPPISFRLSGILHTVVKSIGPERIETGWWRGPHLKRDYFRVTTERGSRVWLFRQRDTDKWFLHGWFD
ncbi:MAG: DNA polymerase Y family protein [Phycisphaerales bacterium]|nr:MAG: DNA polymerase Y family protein [Phycisphaerales bacterium]